MQFRFDRFYQLNRRALIWLALFALIYLMRDFFALIFVTFLLVSFTVPVIDYFTRRTRLPRTVVIVALYLCILTGLGGVIVYITPRVINEAAAAVRELTDVSAIQPGMKPHAVEIPRFTPPATDAATTATGRDDAWTSTVDMLTTGVELADEEQIEQLFTTNIKTLVLRLRDDLQTSYPTMGPMLRVLADEREVERLLGEASNKAAPLFLAAGKKVGAVVTTTLLSLLFSFLIVLDMARLKSEVRRLEHSRLHDFYEQSAGPVVRFASVIARAFRAQAMIAVTNTVLTAIGFMILGLPKVMLLSIVVFFFSFIPVLGVFISTAPAVVIATNYLGYGAAVGVVVLVTLIHAVEAYILNPLIYGHHLKLNPVLVLVILFLGHHFFGLWGMVLGVPVAYYFIYYVFAVPKAHPDGEEDAARLGGLVKKGGLAGGVAPEEGPAANPPGGGAKE